MVAIEEFQLAYESLRLVKPRSQELNLCPSRPNWPRRSFSSSSTISSRHVINPDKAVTVQFNPETLKVSFANQIQTPSGTGDQSGTPTRQFVGAGTTKLALQLWFDVTALARRTRTSRLDDVRKLTQKVAYFITPKKEGKKVRAPGGAFPLGIIPVRWPDGFA